eukprot:SAG22_NODE_528_length_9431_cov_7.192135_6_plen_46_part_00
MASPLLMGTDVSKLSNTSLTIMGNGEVTGMPDCHPLTVLQNTAST